MLAAIARRRDSSDSSGARCSTSASSSGSSSDDSSMTVAAPVGGDDVGIGQLIGLDVARIRHEHGRHAGQGQFGQRRAAGPADDQIAGEHHGRHFVDERHGEGVDADVAVAIDRLLELAFARLMDDLPAVEPSRPAAAALAA